MDEIDEAIEKLGPDATPEDWAKACMDSLSLWHDADHEQMTRWYAAAMRASPSTAWQRIC